MGNKILRIKYLQKSRNYNFFHPAEQSFNFFSHRNLILIHDLILWRNKNNILGLSMDKPNFPFE